MILKNIKIHSFRNIDELSCVFSPHINIIYGDNAQGKTNFLESIYVLGITKSHRLFIDNHLIKNNSDFAKINGTIYRENISTNLDIVITHLDKRLKVDNNIIKLTKDYLCHMNLIIFYPEDLELIKGSPSIRRKYLNIQLSQINNNYYNLLLEYNKILKQRNELLKQLQRRETIDNNLFEILTASLVERAEKIYQYRDNYISNINTNIYNIYKDIMGYENFKIRFVPSIKIENYEKEDLKLHLHKSFKNNYEREVRFGNTLIGPHRDDFEFILDDSDLKIYGSQGQQRIAVISLKLSEIPIFKKYKNMYPILLLDDVFSELDDTKKDNLLKYIVNGIQTFITTTELSSISPVILQGANLINIENGKIIEKED